MSETVLALLAHPDDAEFLCAGTLLRLKEECGFAVHIATMTPGDCGSTEYPPEEIARIRRSLVTLAAEYSTWRMVQEYTKKYYLPPVQ